MAALNAVRVRGNPIYFRKSPDFLTQKNFGSSTMFGSLIRYLSFPRRLKVEIYRLRKFKPDWLLGYPWLVYSKYLDGAFCLPCLCFGIEFGKNGSKLDRLFRSSLTSWTTAMPKFKQHSSGKSEVHSHSVTDMQNFLLVMRNQVVPVQQQLDRLMQEQIRKIRKL